MSVIAKFKVLDKISKEDNGEEIRMSPVIGGSPENDSFFKWTPYGEINIGLVNPDASKQFEVGQEYYVKFEKVQK